MKFEHVSIVLVGLCNEEPLFQTLIGIAVFRKNPEGQFELRLIDPISKEEAGSAKNPYQPTLEWKRKGCYGLCFPDFAGGHGVMINLDKEKGKYHFLTGINRGDSGSSGPISNGGPELVEVLDKLHGFTSSS